MAVQGVKDSTFITGTTRIILGLDYVAQDESPRFFRARDLMEAVAAFMEKRKPNFVGD